MKCHRKAEFQKTSKLILHFIDFQLLVQVSPRPTDSVEYRSVPESNSRLEKLNRQSDYLHPEV